VLIVAEGALAFLGQSVPPPIPTWGKLIDDGRQDLETAWWISLLPAAVMFLTILAFNIMGDVVAKRFEVREAVA
jgi:peptide/nickel transport system permease protein